MESSTYNIPVICGPTASGKTALGIEFAERCGGEIISMDSRQIYRRLDIGTAKPTAGERARVRHHLLDIVDPGDRFTVSDFTKLAREAVSEIISRGKRPIFVGGTPLYLSALLGGFDFCDVDMDQDFRDRLNDEAARIGISALHNRLRASDPESAAKIHPNDLFRIVRSLEIMHLSGKPASTMRAQSIYSQQPEKDGAGAAAGAPEINYKIYCLYVPREKLYDAINKRTLNMYNIGLTDEARTALETYPGSEIFLSKIIGYSEALSCLSGKMTREEAAAETRKRTRRFAKRQLTWLRAVDGAVWIDAQAAGGRAADYLLSKE